MCVYVLHVCPWMTEKGIGCPRSVVIVGCEMPAMGNWIQVIVGEQDVLLTAKPPL